MEIIQVPALGRPFFLGKLYDCKTDKICADKVLWHPSELQERTSMQPACECEYSFTADDSISEKTSFLNISAELKLSLLLGLVNVRGSARYLYDRKTYTRQSRVSFKYRCTTHFVQFNTDNICARKLSLIEKLGQDKATHIVVGILYGMESVFVFDKKLSKTEDLDEVNITLNAMVRCLPGLSIGPNTISKHSNITGDVRCTYHGDVEFENNPTSFDEAIHFFKLLPTKIQQNGENAVPVSVWLYPLCKLSCKIPNIYSRVNIPLIDHIENMFESLDILKMKSNDLLATTACKVNADFRQKIIQLQNAINDSHRLLQFQLAEVIPVFRSCNVNVHKIHNVIKEHKTSQLGISMLDYSLKTMTIQASFLDAFVHKLINVQKESPYRPKDNVPILNILLPNISTDVNNFHDLDTVVLDLPFVRHLRNALKETLDFAKHSSFLAGCEFAIAVSESEYANDFSVHVDNNNVKCICDRAICSYSQESDYAKTNTNLGSLLKKECSILREGVPLVLKFPITITHKDDEAKVRKYDFAANSCIQGNMFDERTILLFGNRDSKTTEIMDGIVNYIADVDFNDSYRFSLDTIKAGDESIYYNFPHTVGSNIQYALNVIDFSVIGGPIIDRETIKMYSSSTLGKSYIHGIVIVIPGELLNQEKDRYIDEFRSIFSSYGNFVDNIFYFVIGDAVETTIKDNMFHFDSSVLFQSNTNDTFKQHKHLLWQKCMSNFKLFGQQLGRVSPISLTKCEDDLKRVQTSEYRISDLQSKVKINLNELNVVKEEVETLEHHKDKIANKETFEYEVTEIVVKHEYRRDKQPSTFCLNCKNVCHDKCTIVIDSEKSQCKVMNEDGNCTECQYHCSWSSHINPAYRSYPVLKKTTKTCSLTPNDFEVLKKSIFAKESSVIDIIIKTTDEINKLKEETDTHAHQITVMQFINQMISNERYERSPGYEERIKELEDFSKKPDILTKVKPATV